MLKGGAFSKTAGCACLGTLGLQAQGLPAEPGSSARGAGNSKVRRRFEAAHSLAYLPDEALKSAKEPKAAAELCEQQGTLPADLGSPLREPPEFALQEIVFGLGLARHPEQLRAMPKRTCLSDAGDHALFACAGVDLERSPRFMNSHRCAGRAAKRLLNQKQRQVGYAQADPDWARALRVHARTTPGLQVDRGGWAPIGLVLAG